MCEFLNFSEFLFVGSFFTQARVSSSSYINKNLAYIKASI